MQEDQNQETMTADTAAAADTAENAGAEAKGGGRKVRLGVVVSNKMNKSITVKVVRRVRHPLYKKYFNKTKKYMAHDETNDCNVGDTVRIVETRPMSANKRWR